MKLKLLIYIIVFLFISFPFLNGLMDGFSMPNGLILESSVFSIDYIKNIKELLINKSIFFSGNDSIYLVNYVPIYGFFGILEYLLGNQIFSYYIGILILLGLSLFSFFKVFKFYLENSYDKSFFINIVIAVVAIIYYTSLSNFFILQSTVFFYLPPIILIIQLYLVLNAYKNNSIFSLILLLIISFFITINLSFFLINLIFLNILFFIFIKKINGKILNNKLFILIFNTTFIPALILILVPLIVNNLYLSSDMSQTLDVIREDFYSMNSSIFTILTQTTFWGLFGGFNGELYYNFSKFYSSGNYYLFGILPYLILISLYILLFKKSQNKKVHILFILFILLIIFFMLGLHNSIYKYLYENIIAFQVFRNITKFAPYLLLMILINIFIFISEINFTKNIQKYLLLSVLSLSIIYNIPFWTYGSNFFDNRTIKSIPEEHIETANFLNKNTNINDKILFLPATYNLEFYNWNNINYNVQGNLYDSLLKTDSKYYRYGELAIGPVVLQKDFKNLLIKSEETPRKLIIDYEKLPEFLDTHGFNYIVVTKDMVSEYEVDIKNIEINIETLGFSELYKSGKVSVYKKSGTENKFIDLLITQDITYHKNNSKYYSININNLTEDDTLILNDYFHKGWKVYIQEFNIIKNISELNLNNEISLFNSSHEKYNKIFNKWELNKEDIIDLGKNYYLLNDDGSINIKLNIYFSYQSYLIYGILFLIISFVISLFIIIIYSYRNKN